MEMIKKRETFTTCEIDGRSFTVNAYDPMVGNYILYQILTSVLPMGIGSTLNSNFGSELVPSDVTKANKMSKEEFVALQVEVLSTVEENMPSGHKAPVVRQNGTYGVQDVSMGLTIKLFIKSIVFNFKDFFSGSQSIEEQFKAM